MVHWAYFASVMAVCLCGETDSDIFLFSIILNSPDDPFPISDLIKQIDNLNFPRMMYLISYFTDT